MPEEIISKLKKSILPEWKVCFLSALVVGLIAHVYKITIWIPNWDSLVFRYDSQNMLSMGRWFLPIASAPSSFYDLPWITGLLAILFFGLGAVCICKMFEVKKKTTAALIGAAVASFPTVTSVMLYNYVADSYALSFLFACQAAVLLTNKKPRYILSAVLICLSVGIYQAYITVTITLLLCYLIAKTMQKDADIKGILAKSLKLLLTGAAGMVLYYLVLMALLKITGTTLLDYQGFSDAASMSGINIFASLYVVKETFLGYFFDFSNGVSAFAVINCVAFAAILVFYLADIIKNKLSILKVALLLLWIILLPIGATALCFINSSIDYHNLMKMGYFAFYLLLILQYEKADFSNNKLNAAKMWTILVVVSALVFNQIIIANVAYHKLGIAYQKSYGTLIRIADRIEQTEGTNNSEKILVLGALNDSENYSVNLPPDITGATDGYILRADDEIVGQSVLCSALNDYCGKNYTFLFGEEKEALLEKIEPNSLENWPGENSICVVDGVVVIKLSD